MLAIGIIVFSLSLGKGIRWLVETKRVPGSWPIATLLNNSIRVVMLGLNPIIIVGAFWYVEMADISLLFLPILGITTLFIGGMLGIGAAKWLKLSRPQTGAMFVSTAFINIGNFGTLFCFVFLGEASIAFVALFKLFEELYYYLIAFPIAKAYGESREKQKQTFLKKVLTDPLILVTFIAIVIGGCLNFSPFERPDFYETVNQILIPLSAFLLVTPIGFSIKFTSIGKYKKESFIVSIIQFFLVPGIITTIAYLLGIGDINNGMVLAVLLIVTAMPPAITSLVPAKMYHLDLDLANSNWLVCTGLLIVVLPILYFILKVI